MEYTIKHVCDTLGLTVHTVRHYCDMGLVPNLKTDSRGNRLFDREAMNWLQAAAFLRSSGMSIPDIREYFRLCQQGRATLAQRQKILEMLREQAQKELEQTRQRIQCLDVRIDACRETLEHGGVDDSNPLCW